MIESLQVSGYKCLMMNEAFAMSNLNILVGANASGKSTFLQSLLLLRQSSDSNGQIGDLHLSGDLYEAGTANDILHPASQHLITFKLKERGREATEYVYQSTREEPRKRRLSIASSAAQLPSSLSDRTGEFCYLNAERIGPRVSYALPPDDMELSGPVGKFGEFTSGQLARSSSDVILIEGWDESVRVAVTSTPLLLDDLDLTQALQESGGRLDLVSNLILGWIVPGASVMAVEEERLDSAPLNFIRDPASTKVLTRATHVGFGLSYSLPIIVAGLSLKPNGLMLVENPEAHLHPFGQSRIGAFLGALAATGRQVIVETHSDHVVNGIRLAIKKQVLRPEDVAFGYFRLDEAESRANITRIGAETDGALDDWPRGFFDQIERDLSRL